MFDSCFNIVYTILKQVISTKEQASERGDMRQYREVTTVTAGIITEVYSIWFEHNHSHIVRNHRCIYDGDEQRVWKWLDAEIDRIRKIAEDNGLTFEVT